MTKDDNTRTRILDANTSVEKVFWLDCIDWESSNGALFDALDEASASDFPHQPLLDLIAPPVWYVKEGKSPDEWVTDPDEGLAEEFANTPPSGFIVLVKRPVPRLFRNGFHSQSWGFYRENAFYVKSLDEVPALAEAFSDAIYAREKDIRDYGTADEPVPEDGQ